MKKSRLGPLASPATRLPSCDSVTAQELLPQALPSQRLPLSVSLCESMMPLAPALISSEPLIALSCTPRSPWMPPKPSRMPTTSRVAALPVFL